MGKSWIGSHKLWHSWWFWIPPTPHTHPPQIRNSMHWEWYKLCPCLGVFEVIEIPCSQQTWLIFLCLFCHIRFRKWRSLIWILTRPGLPHRVLYTPDLPRDMGMKDLGFQTLIRLVPIQDIVLFPSLLKNERTLWSQTDVKL
jgi:hypothetical protein